MIYAVDFDGTLCEGKYPLIGSPKTDNLAKVKQLQADGNQIILWTCRNGDLLNQAVDWCTQQGINFDAVNENLSNIIEKYGGTDSRKITADYYIDDKNMSFNDILKGCENNMVTIPVRGIITNDDNAPVYRDFYGMTAVTSRDVIDNLPDDRSPVTLDIASDGGEVDPATDIYTALRKYRGNVTAQISANAYSAATIVAMGADKVQISPGAKMMIHNAASGAEGNYHDMDVASNMLRTVNKSIADMYAAKTGRPADEFLGLMDKESWLSAQDAIDLGLADEVMSFEPITNLANPPLINHHAIAKIKDLISENQKLKNTTSQISEHEKLVQAKMAIFYGKEVNINEPNE